ncbi:hypothetical protein SCLCIDRAFT_1097015 [Scleroderma citrinum Foug A]|uniref:Uncharacterized protein n=1 Tax=Scleroderma citrinum Foug A TaxID=1036808 RepID=A0A0C3DQW9_9AGAM|nr:hypothetical protein SCLCIDRAFT_1097015 [Scleroderma citrinum Foug A]
MRSTSAKVPMEHCDHEAFALFRGLIPHSSTMQVSTVAPVNQKFAVVHFRGFVNITNVWLCQKRLHALQLNT